VEYAFAEAQLRNTAILALSVWPSGLGEVPYDELDRRLGAWARRYPQVHVQPAAVRSSVAHFLSTHDEPVQLVALGSAHARQIAQLIGPHRQSVLAHPFCSVLVVRQ
jgi:hypothetical protein